MGKASQGQTPNQAQDQDAHLGTLQDPKPLETQRGKRPASSSGALAEAGRGSAGEPGPPTLANNLQTLPPGATSPAPGTGECPVPAGVVQMHGVRVPRRRGSGTQGVCIYLGL